MIPDRPALGAVLARPDVQRRRAMAVIDMRRSLNEHRARTRLMARIGDMQWSIEHGALWGRLADELHQLARAAENVPNRLLELEEQRAA